MVPYRKRVHAAISLSVKRSQWQPGHRLAPKVLGERRVHCQMHMGPLYPSLPQAGYPQAKQGQLK